jgi:hypothetical protein
MTKSSLYFALLILATSPLAATSTPVGTAANDGSTTSTATYVRPEIIAQIGRRSITLQEVQAPEKEVAGLRQAMTEEALARWVTKRERTRLREVILEQLIGHYAQSRSLSVPDEEVAAFVESFRAKGKANRERSIGEHQTQIADLKGKLAAPDLDPTAKQVMTSDLSRAEERLANLSKALELDESMSQHYHGMGLKMLERTKFRRAIWEEFGGLVYQTGRGPEPLDAFEKLAQQLKQAGELRFTSAEEDAAFFGLMADKAALGSPLDEAASKEVMTRSLVLDPAPKATTLPAAATTPAAP